MILALDLGTKTGWATEHGSGVQDFSNKRFEGGGMRYLRFRRWLDEMLDEHGVDEIYYEEVRGHKGTDAAHIYGGLMATLTAWAELNEIPYSGVPVGTIKKYATGKGNAGKSAIMKAYQKKWGVEPQDDNECDARWLLDCVKNG